MGTSRLFMPLLSEFGRLGDGFCYKYSAPNGAPALERLLSNKAAGDLKIIMPNELAGSTSSLAKYVQTA